MATTILVVDDDTPIVEIIAVLLEDAGHTVRRAYDGASALALLQAGGIDLLITDNMMPFLSGVELILNLHAHPKIAVPVILMSAVTPVRKPPDVTFLPKPFDLAKLDALVARMLDGA